MANAHLLMIDSKSGTFVVRTALEQRYNIKITLTTDLGQGIKVIEKENPDCVLLNPTVLLQDSQTTMNQLAQTRASTPLVLVGDESALKSARQIYPYVVGNVPKPYSVSDLLPFVSRTPGKSRRLALAERAQLLKNNRQLEQRLQELTTLFQIGKAVASLTDLDVMLARIVEAAVFLLQAEEGSLLLIDPHTNQLYLRAQKGLGEKHAQGFNMPIQDSLIGSVVRTKKPVMMGCTSPDDDRFKVVTGYLVNALLYVPLALRGEVIGVLGVDNQQSPRAFVEQDQRLLSALADYAAVAIENARQRQSLAQMRQKLTLGHEIVEAIAKIKTELDDQNPGVLDACGQIEKTAELLIELTKSDV